MQEGAPFCLCSFLIEASNIRRRETETHPHHVISDQRAAQCPHPASRIRPCDIIRRSHVYTPPLAIWHPSAWAAAPRTGHRRPPSALLTCKLGRRCLRNKADSRLEKHFAHQPRQPVLRRTRRSICRDAAAVPSRRRGVSSRERGGRHGKGCDADQCTASGAGRAFACSGGPTRRRRGLRRR